MQLEVVIVQVAQRESQLKQVPLRRIWPVLQLSTQVLEEGWKR